MPLNNTGGVSPDGRRLAIVQRGDPDQLIVIAAGGGSPVYRTALPRNSAARWCGSAERLLLLRSDGFSAPMFTMINPESGEERPVSAAGFPSYLFDCSPDGNAVFYQTAMEGRRTMVLQSLVTDEQRELELPDLRQPRSVRWIPDTPPPVPRSLELEPARIVMDWGERTSVEGVLTYSDGSTRAVDLNWRATDPSVASVTSSGIVFANGPGDAGVTAEWDGWLRTSAEVVVSGDQGSGPLLADRFDVLDGNRWLAVGSPPPIPVLRDGEPALLLRGDGLHQDGVISVDPLPLQPGGTIEFEFQISQFTDLVAQRLRVCLIDAGLPDHAADGFELYELAAQQQMCIQYPGGYPSLVQTDRISVVVNPTFATLELPIPEHSGAGEWIHLALQRRADGELSVFVNREAVVRSPIRLESRPESQWRVVLIGYALDTEVLVREFRVWAGERY